MEFVKKLGLGDAQAGVAFARSQDLARYSLAGYLPKAGTNWLVPGWSGIYQSWDLAGYMLEWYLPIAWTWLGTGWSGICQKL